jgi:hypothetical protein
MDQRSWLAWQPRSLLIATSTRRMLLPTPCWILPQFKNEFVRCPSSLRCVRTRLWARSDVKRTAKKDICVEWPYCRSGKAHRWRRHYSRRRKLNCAEPDVRWLRWIRQCPCSGQSVFISGTALWLRGAFRIFSGWSCSSIESSCRRIHADLRSARWPRRLPDPQRSGILSIAFNTEKQRRYSRWMGRKAVGLGSEV